MTPEIRAAAGLASFNWQPKDDGLLFTIEFTDAVRVRATDEALRSGYYYLDFFGASGPPEPAQWEFTETDLRHVRRIYYPDPRVLRFIFYPAAGAGPRFDLTSSKRLFFLSVRRLQLQPLGVKGIAKPQGRRKLVILDPGHGGKSLGAQTSAKIGARNYEEKELTLEIARRLLSLFERSPTIEARMTRSSDVFVSLEERIRSAERSEGDLFLSIHLNATDAKRKDARGFEVYYLTDGTKGTNRQLEDLENDRGVHIDEGLAGGGSLRTILADLAGSKLRERREQSLEVCRVIDAVFRIEGPFRDHPRGIKPAVFRVLMNYGMPSVLVECGFLDCWEDAALLVQPRVQDEIAALLFNAINLYFSRMDPEFQGYLAPHS